GRQRPVLAAREAQQPAGVAGEIVEGGVGPPLGGAEVDAREQPAEVPVPLARLDQQREAGAAGEGEGGAEERPDAGRGRRLVEAHGPVEAVDVDERARRVAERRRLLRERLRLGGALEKAEGAAGVQLDVGRVHRLGAAARLLLAQSYTASTAHSPEA